MTRKEMIETIAKEAGCSKRLVRKKLFNRYLELKKYFPDILFYKVFLDKNTDWHNWNTGERDWRQTNSFDVCCFPSGCVVLFHNVERIWDGEVTTWDVGAKLYSFKTR